MKPTGGQCATQKGRRANSQCPGWSLWVLPTPDTRVQLWAVVFRLFQKTVILPPNPVGFRLTYRYPIARHIFHLICINLLELNTKVLIFSVVPGFCSTNKPISIHYLWKCDRTIMIFINLMLVMISFTHVFKVFNNISASSWAKT